jgi:hypothetical protein
MHKMDQSWKIPKKSDKKKEPSSTVPDQLPTDPSATTTDVAVPLNIGLKLNIQRKYIKFF